MSRKHWTDNDNPDKVAVSAGWRILLIIIVVLLVCGGIGVAVWYFGVATSGVKGSGDITKRNNSADNRIYNQQHFQDLYGDIQSYQVQLVQAAKDKADHPGDDYYATNYTGLYNTCVSAVNQYNADAGKILARDWRDPSLPQQINVSVCTPTSTPDAGVTPTPAPTSTS